MLLRTAFKFVAGAWAIHLGAIACDNLPNVNHRLNPESLRVMSARTAAKAFIRKVEETCFERESEKKNKELSVLFQAFTLSLLEEVESSVTRRGLDADPLPSFHDKMLFLHDSLDKFSKLLSMFQSRATLNKMRHIFCPSIMKVAANRHPTSVYLQTAPFISEVGKILQVVQNLPVRGFSKARDLIGLFAVKCLSFDPSFEYRVKEVTNKREFLELFLAILPHFGKNLTGSLGDLLCEVASKFSRQPFHRFPAPEVFRHLLEHHSGLSSADTGPFNFNEDVLNKLQQAALSAGVSHSENSLSVLEVKELVMNRIREIFNSGSNDGGILEDQSTTQSCVSSSSRHDEMMIRVDRDQSLVDIASSVSSTSANPSQSNTMARGRSSEFDKIAQHIINSLLSMPENFFEKSFIETKLNTYARIFSLLRKLTESLSTKKIVKEIVERTMLNVIENTLYRSNVTDLERVLNNFKRFYNAFARINGFGATLTRLYGKDYAKSLSDVFSLLLTSDANDPQLSNVLDWGRRLITFGSLDRTKDGQFFAERLFSEILGKMSLGRLRAMLSGAYTSMRLLACHWTFLGSFGTLEPPYRNTLANGELPGVAQLRSLEIFSSALFSAFTSIREPEKLSRLIADFEENVFLFSRAMPIFGLISTRHLNDNDKEISSIRDRIGEFIRFIMPCTEECLRPGYRHAKATRLTSFVSDLAQLRSKKINYPPFDEIFHEYPNYELPVDFLMLCERPGRLRRVTEIGTYRIMLAASLLYAKPSDIHGKEGIDFGKIDAKFMELMDYNETRDENSRQPNVGSLIKAFCLLFEQRNQRKRKINSETGEPITFGEEINGFFKLDEATITELAKAYDFGRYSDFQGSLRYY